MLLPPQFVARLASERLSRRRPIRVTLASMVSWILAILVVAALPVVSATSLAAAQQRPNILLIMVDDLGYGDLSSYGARDLRTPHVDRLVRQGQRWNSFYANCPVCSPTRASLLSGRYPELVGVPGVVRTHWQNNWGYLDPEAVLLPQVLQATGYHTAIIGKWHLGLEEPNRPNDRGFDYFHGFLGDMMDDYYHHRRHGNNYMRHNERVIEPEGHATDLFSDWASDYLHEAKQSERPFFLYLAYNAPHTPIQPPDEWVDRVRQREPGIEAGRAKLVALIEHMDAGIGRVLETLEQTGLADNTLVIFTSDNGGQVSVGADNGGLRDGKQSMYEGGIRVPFAAVWPERIRPATEARGLGVTMDLFPTICEAAGVPVQHPIDGRSLYSVLTAETDEQATVPFERDVFFHRREGGERYQGLTIHAMRRGPWKLLKNSPFEPFELYNLDDDPTEQHNLAESHRKPFRELSAAMRVHIQRGGAVPWQRPAMRDTPGEGP